jgi:hypothetical protein
MKNLLFNLSSVSEFFNEKRFIFDKEVAQPAPEAPKAEKKDLPQMAKDTNEASARASAESIARAREAANLPGLDEAVARLVGKPDKLNPNKLDKSAQVAAVKPGENVPHIDAMNTSDSKHPNIKLSSNAKQPSEDKPDTMPTIEKKGRF